MEFLVLKCIVVGSQRSSKPRTKRAYICCRKSFEMIFLAEMFTDNLKMANRGKCSHSTAPILTRLDLCILRHKYPILSYHTATSLSTSTYNHWLVLIGIQSNASYAACIDCGESFRPITIDTTSMRLFSDSHKLAGNILCVYFQLIQSDIVRSKLITLEASRV